MDQRVQKVHAALDLLARFEPEAYDHIVREARDIVFGPAWCPPNSIACTGGPLGRHIVLIWDPLTMDLVELAATIFHEGLHLWSDPSGRLVTAQHQCDPCRTFEAQARDWIYREEAALQARLRAATGIRKQPTFPAGKVVGALAVGALAALAVSAVASAVRS
jgi:hypothetical protein